MPEPKAIRDIDRSVVRIWDADEPQRVLLDDAAQVIAAETGVRAIAADVSYQVHSMGQMIDSGLMWTTVILLPSRTPILAPGQQASIVSGDTDMFYRTCNAVSAHIKSHPALYFSPVSQHENTP